MLRDVFFVFVCVFAFFVEFTIEGTSFNIVYQPSVAISYYICNNMFLLKTFTKLNITINNTMCICISISI